MANKIDELPDETISYILSFLTIRETLIARLSSSKWLNLPDSRSIIRLSSDSVLDESTLGRYNSPAVKSEFMKIANRFMQLWSGNRMTTLIVRYEVDGTHIGEIQNWIAKAFRMKVERIEIDVSTRFVFPCSAIQRDCNPHLKQLCLGVCFLDLGYTNWLSNLTKLRLFCVPLDSEKMNLILSSATILIELDLLWCKLRDFRIDGQLLHLKRLKIIHSSVVGKTVRLNCPSLEAFDYRGPLASLKFVHVPVLREAKFRLTGTDICYMFFNDINVQAPSLEALSITVGLVIRPVPPNLVRYSLKQLKLKGGFDPLRIGHLLNACPCLEELEVKLLYDDITIPEIGAIGRREHWDESKHHKLRKVKIQHLYDNSNDMKLAEYILRNAVALEEMKILTHPQSYLIEYYQSLRLLKEKVNPTAQFVVSHDINRNLRFKRDLVKTQHK